MDQSLRNLAAAGGALVIMMRSGAILDFELFGSDHDVVVRVSSPGDVEESRLRAHVAALLAGYVDESRVMVETEIEVSS